MHAERARAESPVAMMATLGSMHAGHEALLEAARAAGRTVVASLFLNPTQFDDPSDLERYPVDVECDLEIFAAHGVDVVFKPSVTEMYPDGGSTTVDPGPLGRVLEGARRPGHFTGVATVVAKLLTIIRPDVAVWGAKDAQQNVVVRRISRDLGMAVKHVVVPTVRDADGLALSSRNTRLSEGERAAAPALHRALEHAREGFAAGETDAARLRAAVRAAIDSADVFDLEYVSLADPDTLEELETARTGALLSLAARLGTTRLIDNVVLDGGA